MSIVKEGRVAIVPPNADLLRLVQRAAEEIIEEVHGTEDTVITKLKRRVCFKEIQKEYISSYQNTIRHDSLVGTIFHPNFIQAPFVPEVFVLKKGAFEIAEKYAAIAIPLVVEGNATIEYEEGDTSTPMEWSLGSVIYMAGDAGIRSDGQGVVTFLMILYRLKTV